MAALGQVAQFQPAAVEELVTAHDVSRVKVLCHFQLVAVALDSAC
jgi:hypothetical protein